jgi:hypothetical protein
MERVILCTIVALSLFLATGTAPTYSQETVPQDFTNCMPLHARLGVVPLGNDLRFPDAAMVLPAEGAQIVGAAPAHIHFSDARMMQQFLSLPEDRGAIVEVMLSTDARGNHLYVLNMSEVSRDVARITAENLYFSCYDTQFK